VMGLLAFVPHPSRVVGAPARRGFAKVWLNEDVPCGAASPAGRRIVRPQWPTAGELRQVLLRRPHKKRAGCTAASGGPAVGQAQARGPFADSPPRSQVLRERPGGPSQTADRASGAGRFFPPLRFGSGATTVGTMGQVLRPADFPPPSPEGALKQLGRIRQS